MSRPSYSPSVFRSFRPADAAGICRAAVSEAAAPIRRSLRAVWLVCGAALLSLGLAPVAHALDLKPGEWEQTMSMNMTGAPPVPPDVLAKMSPEAREQLMARMKNPRSHTARTCVTAEQIARFDKDGLEGDQDPNNRCTRQVKSNTARRAEYHVECVRGAMTLKSDIVITSAGPEQYVMVSSGVATQNGQTTQNKVDIQGRWIGATCSKPSQ
ncbi:MAG: DUF3617 domain-containing protein [Burkholderiaceae bacterium]